MTRNGSNPAWHVDDLGQKVADFADISGFAPPPTRVRPAASSTSTRNCPPDSRLGRRERTAHP